ncbi:Sm-like ribonucleo protein [Calocera cornea HHB12733]|uniref:LSM complex subunit LSM4 n=1 Tax=Calocera cornea HHB12733 TaxID=1353952 RepID=A0A165IYV8_9BASI|nr:Sm-like ribonucleo protein [Calocera cornea HHB12733]
MLPLSLLNAAQNKPMLVELKNGETLNGHLVNCDNFMNITLREVYQTSSEGERFWKLKECYVRGSTIKYLRVPDQLLDEVQVEQFHAREMQRGGRGGQRGGRGAPQRGRGGGGGGGRGMGPGRGGRARGRGRGA